MNRITKLVLLGSALTGFAACAASDEGPNPGPNEPNPPAQQLSAEEYDEVAQSVGGVVVTTGGGGEVGAIADSVSIAHGVVPLGFTVSASGDIEGQHGGLSYRYQLTCADAAGQTQPACDDATDRADVTIAWSGTLELPRFRLDTERNGSWTLTGLTGDTAALAGDSDFHVAVEAEPLAGPQLRTYDLDYTASYDAIRIDNADGDIVAGSAHFAIAAERTESGNGHDSHLAFDVDAVVTFDGDDTATLVLDGQYTYELDLATGRAQRLP